MTLDKYEIIIFDRDGVINVDRPDCVHNLAEFETIPGSIEAIAEISKLGKTTAIATNQSCIGRGWVTPKTLAQIHNLVVESVEELGGSVDAVYVCPHAPDAGCECRKPAPQMLSRALEQFRFENVQALYFGDSVKDYEAAEKVGIDFCLVRTGKGKKSEAILNERYPDRPVCKIIDALRNWREI